MGGKRAQYTQFRVRPALGDDQARGRARGDCFRPPRMVAYRHRDGWPGCKPAAKRSLARSVLLAFRTITSGIDPAGTGEIFQPANACFAAIRGSTVQ